MSDPDNANLAAILGQLRSALSLLAATKGQQKARLSSLGVWPSIDELGLEYDDIYPTAHGLREAGCISVTAEETLDEISALLSTAAEEEPHFWSADSLDGDTWRRARNLAQRALSELEAGP